MKAKNVRKRLGSSAGLKYLLSFSFILLTLGGCTNENTDPNPGSQSVESETSSTDTAIRYEDLETDEGATDFFSELPDNSGYLLHCGSAAMGYMEKYLFYTEDGGSNYSDGIDLTETIPNYPADMLFIDQNTGFIITDYHTDERCFFTTSDGGNTWNTVELEYPVDQYQYAYGISIEQEESSGDLKLLIGIATDDSDTRTEYEYSSTDAGSSWILSN